MACFKRGKFALTVLILQIVFIVLFGVFADYSDSANAKVRKNSLDPSKGGADPGANEVADIYPSKHFNNFITASSINSFIGNVVRYRAIVGYG